jgi:putative heme-binding domain-containing protein
MFVVMVGAQFLRQAGNHFNPYVYQDINTIADHVHWLGDMGPHAGNNKSAAAGGGHAHCGAMIYLADSWPAEFRDTLFMANIHGNRFNNDRLVPTGSGYVGTHAPDPILMNDRWSRLINLKYGPDGSVYAIDWYDKQACHMQNPEIWDRTNGRIYKFIYKDQPAVKVDLASKSDEELADLMLSKNDWYVRHARRLLQERASATAGQSEAPPRVSASTQKLTALFSNEDVTRRLRGLWALHCVSALTPELTASALKDADPYMRSWAIQLAAEHFGPMNLTNFAAPRPQSSPQAAEYVSTFAEMAKSDASPIVRLYLAGACQRIPIAQRGPIVEALLAHADDATDHNLPLMYWYAAEPIVGADISRGAELAKTCAIPLVRELIARRICAEATKVAAGEIEKINPAPLGAVAKLLDETTDPAAQRDVLAGMQAGLTGWQKLPMPENWPQVAAKLSASDNADVRSLAQAISVVFGEEHAMASLRKLIPDTQQSAQVRRDAIASLVGAKDRALPAILQSLLSDPVVCSSALRGLAAFDDPNTPAAIVKAYPSMGADNRLEALNALASRVEYARQFKAAMEAGIITRADVSAATLRQLGSLESEDIKSWVASTFGQVRQSPAEKQKQIQALIKTIGPRVDRADVANGRALFAKTCMQCHTLFDTGGKVGPDLTGSNRADLNYVLSNIVDPSAVIAKEYMVSIIRLKDKRVISGIVKGDDGNALTVRTENESLTIPRSDVVRQTQQNISMMPEGLLATMQPDEIRDLLGYLRSSKQSLMLATKYNANSFFNGKDLTNWSGDTKLWSVQNGEIVGKTDGLEKNRFLFSDMLAGDFKLTLKVKLIGNTGNSGVQFRSESLPDGEARGYQADIGPGWWGKLYEENGRALMVKEGGEQWLKTDDWNDYEITAIGSKIHTTLNGHPCVDIDDPTGAKRGRIAFQLHAGGPTEVRFKEIKLEVK